MPIRTHRDFGSLIDASDRVTIWSITKAPRRGVSAGTPVDALDVEKLMSLPPERSREPIVDRLLPGDDFAAGLDMARIVFVVAIIILAVAAAASAVVNSVPASHLGDAIAPARKQESSRMFTGFVRMVAAHQKLYAKAGAGV